MEELALGFDEAVDDAQERGLAGMGRADYRDDGVGLDVEIHTA
jgi:homoserine dehydrogenase